MVGYGAVGISRGRPPGKAGHVRTVPVPGWVKSELEEWLSAAAIDRGKVFRRVNKVGKTWGDGMIEKAVWHIVKNSAQSIGVAKLAPHDLRRTCARLCHASGGETRANPIPSGACLSANDGTLSWLQAADTLRRE